jgi:hypothetical protein
MARYEAGDMVPVRVLRWWDTRGFHAWDVYRVGDCERPIEDDSEGSYDRSQACERATAYGLPTGFICNRRAERELLEVCPWLERR